MIRYFAISKIFYLFIYGCLGVSMKSIWIENLPGKIISKAVSTPLTMSTHDQALWSLLSKELNHVQRPLSLPKIGTDPYHSLDYEQDRPTVNFAYEENEIFFLAFFSWLSWNFPKKDLKPRGRKFVF